MKTRPKLAPISEEMKRWSALLGEELSRWPAVTSQRVFSMTGYYRKGRIFALLPRIRALETPNSVAFKIYQETARTSKLLSADARIASGKIKMSGWIAFELATAADLKDALKWFDLAYQNCLSRKNSKS